jgi:hypothetical protein
VKEFSQSTSLIFACLMRHFFYKNNEIDEDLYHSPHSFNLGKNRHFGKNRHCRSIVVTFCHFFRALQLMYYPGHYSCTEQNRND